MSRVELTAIRGYIRQATFLAMRKHTTEALELIFLKAKNDTDISEDGYKILCALCDGISDYQDICNNSL